MRLRSSVCITVLTAILTSAFSCAAFAAEQPNLDKSRAVLQELERVQARIAELEYDSGPYDPNLLEPLQALAELYLTAEDFEAVAETQSRQLQIMRTELGLDHPDNIAMVNLIIANNIRMAEWSEVADNLEHIRYLEGVNGAGDVERLLTAIDAQASWSIAQLTVGEPRMRARHLLDARESYDEIKDIAEDAYGEDDLLMVPWLYKRAINLYQLVAILNGANSLSGDTLDRVIQKDGVGRLQAFNSRPGFGGGGSFGRNFQIPILDPDSLIGEAYLRDALSELNQITDILEESGDVEGQAMANIYHGDFRVLLGLGSGSKSYRKAQELLQQAGFSEDRISQFFAIPQVIPEQKISLKLADAEAQIASKLVPSIGDENVLINQFIALHEFAGNVGMPESIAQQWGLNPPADIVELSLNINSRGEVSARKFLAASSEDKGIRRKALRSVRGLKFRPRFEKDKAVRVRGLALSYRFEENPR